MNKCQHIQKMLIYKNLIVKVDEFSYLPYMGAYARIRA